MASAVAHSLQPTAAPAPPPAPAAPPKEEESKRGGSEVVTLFRSLALGSATRIFPAVGYKKTPIEEVYTVNRVVAEKVTPVVLKVLRQSSLLDLIKREEEVIKLVNRRAIPHAVPLLDSLVNPSDPFFKTDKADCSYALVLPHAGETLKDVCEKSPPLPLRYWREVTRQILETLAALAAKKFAHEDLSYKNVLIAGNPPVVTIIDWEALRTAPHQKGYAKAVCHFRAPEYYVGMSAYTTSVDIWALGCLLYAMATGRSFMSKDEEQALPTCVAKLGMPSKAYAESTTRGCFVVAPDGKVTLKEGTVEPADVSVVSRVEAALKGRGEAQEIADFIDLMMHMLLWEPEKRISAQAALHHKFLTSHK